MGDITLLTSGQQVGDYSVLNLLSIGGFGQVYSVYNQCKNVYAAIKVESTDAEIPLLKNEATCLQHINQHHNPNSGASKEPILQFFNYGEQDNVRYFAMDLSGRNLRELKKSTPGDQFSIRTSLWILERMISALKYVHSLGWLHRDVKPANFCIGLNDPQQLYLIDFGMCRYYLSSDGTPKPRKPYNSFHGTVRYASLNTHNRQDMSRWDDLWPVFYIAVENMVGSLPWRLIECKTEVSAMKTSCNLLALKYGELSEPPTSLVVMHRLLSYSYVAAESFYVRPNYEEMLNQIVNELTMNYSSPPLVLDWETNNHLDAHVQMGAGDFAIEKPAIGEANHGDANMLNSVHGRSYYFF